MRVEVTHAELESVNDIELVMRVTINRAQNGVIMFGTFPKAKDFPQDLVEGLEVWAHDRAEAVRNGRA